MVVSPLPSLGIMPSCAAAAEYRAFSKAPLSILFWPDLRFKLRSELSSICWQMGKTLPRLTILDHKMQFLILMND